jgi:hypothetical protein
MKKMDLDVREEEVGWRDWRAGRRTHVRRLTRATRIAQLFTSLSAVASLVTKRKLK